MELAIRRLLLLVRTPIYSPITRTLGLPTLARPSTSYFNVSRCNAACLSPVADNNHQRRVNISEPVYSRVKRINLSLLKSERNSWERRGGYDGYGIAIALGTGMLIFCATNNGRGTRIDL